MTLNSVLCPISVQNQETCTFWSYIYIYSASTYSDKKQHHFTTLPLYHLHTENIERQDYIRGQKIVVREIVALI